MSRRWLTARQVQWIKVTMSHAQQGPKRAKVKEGRVVENTDYFQGKVEYNNMASSTETTNYHYYNSEERIHSRNIEDWLKFSVSLTEFKNGPDNCRHHGRPWDDGTNSIDNYKRCIKAFFDFCLKLGVKYWTAFDTDLVPLTDNWEENKTNWEEIADYLQDLLQKNHLKVLWLAPDLHSNLRYTSGAMSSNDATTFVQAATQIKKCLEMSQRLNAECFLLWPYREGYDAIFQTDMAKEIKLFAKLLKATAEYRDILNYKCQLLVMPYNDFATNHPRQSQNGRESDVLNKYMWDMTSCLYFMKNFNLDRHFKICSPPGHHMYMANVYNVLGGVTITDQFDEFNDKSITLMLKCIIDQGAVPVGGINLRICKRRDSDLKEMVISYVKYIDAVAKGLRVACNIVAEQVFYKSMQQRYVTYNSGFGSRILSNEISMEECEEYNKKNQVQTEPPSPKTEHYNSVFQRYLDACDHV